MPSIPATTEPAAPGGAVLELDRLTVSFATRRGTATAAREVSLAVARGECLGVIGESGAGKSQLFLAALGLLAANGRASGSARFAGTELLGLAPAALDRIRGARIGVVFQDPMSSLTPHLRVGEQLIEVLVRHTGVTRVEARRRALTLLERVQLTDAARRMRQYPHELSGGMRQRAMIAIALSCHPQLLIADEPTTALDVTVQAQILALLAELKRERALAMVLITHDVCVVAGVADRVAVMRGGRVVESGPVAAVLKSPRDPYTRELLRPLQLRPGEPARTLPAGGSGPALTVAGVGVEFTVGRGWFRPHRHLSALCDVSFEVQHGEALGVVGESGAGKSTLVRCVLALPLPVRGRVAWLGRELARLGVSELRALRERVQIVFQDPLGSLDPRMTAQQAVGEPLLAYRPQLGRTGRAAASAKMLERVGLDAALGARYPHELSGGQCQRVGIARAMVLQPQILVCDEPLSALDAPTRQQILVLLAGMRAASLTLVIVSHDVSLVRGLCDRVLVLYLGRMMEIIRAERLEGRARHPYTRELLAAVPLPDPELQPARLRQARSGEPPSPLDPPSGCVYRTRCPHALPLCAERRPEWEDAGDGERVACHRWRELG